MRIVMVVNGGAESAMGIRARGLCSEFEPHWSVAYLYREAESKWEGASAFAKSIEELRPDVVYVLDLGAAGILGALRVKLSRSFHLIVDTGDAITALARAAKLRGSLGIGMTWVLEQTGLRCADSIVVRGEFHAEYLRRKGIHAHWIPDGYEPELFFGSERPTEASSGLTLGLLGSITWNGSLEATYGWDLVTTLGLLKDLPIQGLLVGDGSGLARLKEYAHSCGVDNRIHFAGRVAYQNLRQWIHQMDICLSTQTNDLPGQVRTTGKLPLYLACGRFILASRVGQAARVLPESMLVDYDGSRDAGYPAKLAQRIRELFLAGADLTMEGQALSRRVAREFSYPLLSAKLAALIRGALRYG